MYQLGLALSGGSIKGFAHLGVLKRLEELNIRPDIIAGTSAGSIVGAFYADGYAPDEIFELLRSQSFSSLSRISLSGSGVFDTTKLTQFLKTHLRHKRIEDLAIPLRVVATDLDAGSQHIFTEGNLAHIITASCCIPVLFRPVEIQGVHYVDGGIFRNFPVSVLREDCERIIGVNLGPQREQDYKKNIMGVADRAWELVFRQNTQYDKQLCDILLETEELLQYGMFDVDAAQEIMLLGYKLAKERL